MYSFSTEDLLQYIYDETSTDKSAAIKTAIQSDWALREKMEILKASIEQLDEVALIAPNAKSVDNILKYAEKEVVEFSEKI